jgi:hypothetical protein
MALAALFGIVQSRQKDWQVNLPEEAGRLTRQGKES